MYKNPSFCTTMEVIRNNIEKHNRKDITIGCLISYDGTMILYETMDEVLNYFRNAPESERVHVFVQYLHDTRKYFFHKIYEFMPPGMPTPEMDGRIMMWKQALFCQGVEVRPARTTDLSDKGFVKASQLIIDSKKYEERGMSYHNGDIDFLENCRGNALVNRLSHYNDVGIFCVKVDAKKKSTKDPMVMFQDSKKRPAIARKSLSDFIDTYVPHMKSDDYFEVFVYPDGTAANMSNWSDIETKLAIPDDELEKYIRTIEPEDVVDDILDNMDEEDRFFFRLQLLRIICIIGTDTVIMPTPITPRQSVFLEGLQETGHILMEESNIVRLHDCYDMSIYRMKQKTPMAMSNGFMFGGTSYFCWYSQLSPDMQERVDSVMKLTPETREKYLFDATYEDRLFVVEMDANL